MAITITKLHPLFCAEIGGVDTGAPMDDAVFGEIRTALDEYSVLVFHGQSLDDERQIAFSRRFGPLENSGKANPATGTPFARQSNLDIATGAVIPAEDRRMVYQKGNYNIALQSGNVRLVKSDESRAVEPHQALFGAEP